MSRHTPGPWHVCRGNHICAGEKMVALVDYNAEGLSHGSPEIVRALSLTGANALLIAAAPEMLQALNRIVNACKQQPDGQHDWWKILEAIGESKEIITKATGK